MPTQEEADELRERLQELEAEHDMMIHDNEEKFGPIGAIIEPVTVKYIVLLNDKPTEFKAMETGWGEKFGCNHTEPYMDDEEFKKRLEGKK